MDVVYVHGPAPAALPYYGRSARSIRALAIRSCQSPFPSRAQ